MLGVVGTHNKKLALLGVDEVSSAGLVLNDFLALVCTKPKHLLDKSDEWRDEDSDAIWVVDCRCHLKKSALSRASRHDDNKAVVLLF